MIFIKHQRQGLNQMIRYLGANITTVLFAIRLQASETAQPPMDPLQTKEKLTTLTSGIQHQSSPISFSPVNTVDSYTLAMAVVGG